MAQLSGNFESNLIVAKYPKGWHTNVITSNHMDVVVQLVHVGGQLKSELVSQFGGAIGGLRRNRFSFPNHSILFIVHVYIVRGRVVVILLSDSLASIILSMKSFDTRV